MKINIRYADLSQKVIHIKNKKYVIFLETVRKVFARQKIEDKKTETFLVASE